MQCSSLLKNISQQHIFVSLFYNFYHFALSMTFTVYIDIETQKVTKPQVEIIIPKYYSKEEYYYHPVGAAMCLTPGHMEIIYKFQFN